jgi:hypothetical protein
MSQNIYVPESYVGGSEVMRPRQMRQTRHTESLIYCKEASWGNYKDHFKQGKKSMHSVVIPYNYYETVTY